MSIDVDAMIVQAFSNKQYPLLEAFSLINDPRNEYGKLYTVEKLGNVWNGTPIRCEIVQLFIHLRPENTFFIRRQYDFREPESRRRQGASIEFVNWTLSSVTRLFLSQVHQSWSTCFLWLRYGQVIRKFYWNHRYWSI